MQVFGEKPRNVKFTDDQADAVDDLIEFIAAPWSDTDYIHGLCGAGGTGKTFVTKYVIQNCKYSSSVIACAAPTHKACRVFSNAIGGKTVETIQSIFGFRLDANIENFDPENPTFNPIGKVKILDKEIRLLIIDESSMLNGKLVGYINKLCKKHQIKIIYIGDSSQLPPVNERISRAFTVATRINYLNETVRQGDNNPISELLSILRNDIAKGKYDMLKFISDPKNKSRYNEKGCGFTVCGAAEFNYYIEQAFTDEAYTNNVDMYRIIAYTNAKVTSWNNYIRQMIIKGAEKSIITKNDLIMSYTTVVDDFNDIIINNSEEYIVHDIADFQDPTFDFKCFMIKFQAIHGGSITQPLCVIDHTDKYTLQLYFNKLNNLINDAKTADGSSRSAKWKEYFKFKRKYLLANNILNSYGKITFSRDIDYGFAITSHKSQGSTYQTVFVDVNDMVYDKYGHPYTNQDELLRRLYVACSRPSNELILCYGR